MKNRMIRLSWVSVVLLLGHLAMVVGLALAARTERPTHPAARPDLSILNCLRD
jgi:hypothetical protein